MNRDTRLPLDTAQRISWATRTFLVTLTGVSTGAIAHVLMGGHPPNLLSLVPALVFSALLSLGLTKHTSPLRLGFAAGVSQAVFHALFVLEAGPSPMAHSPLAHGSLEHSVLSVSLSQGSETWMSLGHALAAAVSASSVSVFAATLRLFGELREVLYRVAELGDLTAALPHSAYRSSTGGWGTSEQQVRRASRSTRAPPAVLG